MPSHMPSLPCQGYAEDQQLYEIDGVVFTFGHTVLDPADGVFKHAEDVIDAKKLDHRIPVVRVGLQKARAGLRRVVVFLNTSPSP